MKKTMFLLLIALAGRSTATPVDSLEARAVAEQFYAALQPDRGTLQIRNTYVHSFGGVVTQYLFVFENNDFMLVAADDAFFPILAYSREPSFCPGEVPPDLSWWLETEYDRRILEAHQKGSVNPAMRAIWDGLLRGEKIPLKAENSVPPLVSSHWGQARTNDHQCPGYNEKVPYPSLNCYCSKCTAGCVAVAMAQIMNYWKYPASQGERVFDWCHMPDRLIKYDGLTVRPSFAAECNAIAGLLVNCGSTANLSYCVSGCATGSTLGQAASALQHEYAYKSGLQHRYRTITANWKEKLRSSIDQGMPVLYGGQSGSGGHAFVCDAYEGEVYFHFNWGWNGAYDAYYYISDNDGQPEIEYDALQEALFFIEPEEIPQLDCNPCDNTLDIANSLSEDRFNEALPNLIWTGLPPEYNFNPDLNPFIPVASVLIHPEDALELVYDDVQSGTLNVGPVVIPGRIHVQLKAYKEINITQMETLPGAEFSAEIVDCPAAGRMASGLETTAADADTARDPGDDLQLWPNPASDFLNVAFNAENDGSVKLILRDENGSRVRTFTEKMPRTGPFRFRMPVNSLTPGHYFLEIRTNGGVRVGKVVLG